MTSLGKLRHHITFDETDMTSLGKLRHHITYDESDMTSLGTLRRQSLNTRYVFMAVKRYQLQGVLELHTVFR